MKKLFLFLLFIFLFFSPQLFASGTQTVNGIPLEDVDFGAVTGIRALYFTGYTFGSTTVYNEVGSTTSTSGMVDVSKYPTKSIGIRITNIGNGGTLTVKINEFIGTTTFPFTAVTINHGTTSTDYTVPIAEYCEFISVSGVATTGTVTADIIGLNVRTK